MKIQLNSHSIVGHIICLSYKTNMSQYYFVLLLPYNKYSMICLEIFI